ncbi:hypothetical protein F0P96_12670 [Hymenobacter busanensis]|uniref:Uncharacterized protein n=1 Tax=Hymenobacter busanensis TaxID=2607656 RepID=A0A7L4ZVV2_9BACT|nr:hypothetical protein [Hymenobacter busanensis]KAA9332325.1 hypothetical protein F0P96_12670 [Hymenobacter busanensis]QHJ07338.1 hypothetical protein GUY19_08605 [Hymenobacter busanensis]
MFSPAAEAAIPAAPINTLLTFVRAIGVEVREASLAGTATFLPGLLIDAGQLVIDRSRLLHPGDILHEAGHIAVTPAADRPRLGGNITAGHPEKEGEELAVLAWSFAASQALQLPPEVVFHPDGYKGQSAWLIENYERGHYLGLPLLAWMGLTTADSFPRMTRWLRT